MNCIAGSKVPNEQEWQEKAQTFPHPGVEAINSDVHVLPLPQRPQSVQAALLVDILEVLEECHVHIEHHVLVPEFSVSSSIWPDKQDTTHYT